MFTGIVEETGTISAFEERGEAWRLVIRANRCLEDIALGDSIAVNGCCLTVVEFDTDSIAFDLLSETVRLTSIQEVAVGSKVNLERSLKYHGKIGGHFVTGHIDGLGKVAACEKRGKDFFLRIEPPKEFLKYLVYKGCIAIDGISLTVAEVDNEGFDIWIIPHTLEVTNLSEKQQGALVNLEFDILAKYVEKLRGPSGVL